MDPPTFSRFWEMGNEPYFIKPQESLQLSCDQPSLFNIKIHISEYLFMFGYLRTHCSALRALYCQSSFTICIYMPWSSSLLLNQILGTLQLISSFLFMPSLPNGLSLVYKTYFKVGFLYLMSFVFLGNLNLLGGPKVVTPTMQFTAASSPTKWIKFLLICAPFINRLRIFTKSVQFCSRQPF